MNLIHILCELSYTFLTVQCFDSWMSKALSFYNSSLHFWFISIISNAVLKTTNALRCTWIGISLLYLGESLLVCKLCLSSTFLFIFSLAVNNKQSQLLYILQSSTLSDILIFCQSGGWMIISKGYF